MTDATTPEQPRTAIERLRYHIGETGIEGEYALLEEALAEAQARPAVASEGLPPCAAGWDAPAGTFDGSGYRRPQKDELPGQHREPCMCKVCLAARKSAGARSEGLRAALERLVAFADTPMLAAGREHTWPALLREARAALASDAPEARYTDGCLTDEAHAAHKATSDAGSVGALDVDATRDAMWDESANKIVDAERQGES